jgi:hypothetical protein
MQDTNNKLFITTPFGEEVLYEANRDAFDRTGSAALYQKHFGERFDCEDHLFFIIGTDSGLLPQWLVSRGIPNGTRVVFIELPGIIDVIRERLGDIVDDKRLILCTLDDWAGYKEQLRLDEYLYLRNAELVDSLAAVDAHIPEYRTTSFQLDQQLTQYNQLVQSQFGNLIFFQRQLENIGDNLWPVRHLQGAFSDWPAVILGGGPSLDEMLPWIQANRERLLVIAVSRVCRQLRAKGLQPDIVVSVDPQDISFDVSKDMLRLSPDTLFVNAFHVSPLLLGQWHGRAAYSGGKYPWNAFDSDHNMPAIGPTVTNNALILATYLKCPRIILAGVDLCYSREGASHAAGSSELLAGPALAWVGTRVETNGGWQADTHPNLAMAIPSMGEQAGEAAKQGLQVINPASGAAKIPNVQHRQLDDIALDPMQERVIDIIDRHMPRSDADARRSVLKETARELASANGRLRKVLHLIEDALDSNAKLHNGDFRHKQRMDKIERSLDKEFSDLTRVVKDCAAAAFLRLSRPDREREWTTEEIERWGQDYYQTYQLGARQLLAYVEAAQQKVASRLDELSDRPDLAALLARWASDRTPGRAKMWLASRPLDALEPALAGQMQQLAESFEQILDNQDTAQARHFKDGIPRRMALIRSKLHLLFEHADRDEIAHITGLLDHYGVPEADELKALGLGYLAELDGRPDEAFAHYHLIVDRAAEQIDTDAGQARNPRLEDALRRMSVIALQKGDADSAISVLDVLSALSPIYEPQYASILRLTGRVQDAVQVYTHYLERVPNDLATMLKLGKLFQDAGVEESARWAYDYVLDKDPDNPAARQLRDALAG